MHGSLRKHPILSITLRAIIPAMPNVEMHTRRKRLLFAFAGCFSLLLLSGIGFTFSRSVPLIAAVFGEKENTTLLPSKTGDSKEAIPVSAEILLGQAERERSRGNARAAILLYEKALERGGELPVMQRLFDTALLVSDTEKAESVMGLLSFRGVPDLTLEALRGQVLLRKGKLDEARTLFAAEPNRSEYRYGLTLTSILEGNHGEAKEHLAVLGTSNDPAMAHAARVIMGAYDEFALFEDGSESHLQTLLARSLGQIGEWPAAATLLTNVVSGDPDYRDAQILLGYSLFMMDAPENAFLALEQAYRIDPEKAETQYFLGLTHRRLGHSDEALTFLSHALQNGFVPKRPLREELAELSVERGAYEEAIGQYRAIVDEGEADVIIYRKLITLLIDHHQDLEGARVLAGEAREALGDSSADVLEEDLNEAATFLQTATEQDPTLGSAWLHRALLHEKLGERTEALSAYKRAYEESVARNQEIALVAAEKYNALLMQQENTVSP